MSKLRVSRDATADLDEIWLHIANRGGVEAAQRYINHLTAKKIGIRSHRWTITLCTTGIRRDWSLSSMLCMAQGT